ncbi:MAG: chromosome segregation protein SMC [Clostridia bacterium]|nr:chromosome segregation protein SMC [Clostridia bacterium]
MSNEITTGSGIIPESRLRRLELQGFKSFPDKTVIEFREGITAIVGPNGSGKSNIADALRWVLGETSSKTLRGAKMEDVIFNGTKERKAMGYAEVSICLDNADRMFDIDYAEIVVTRRFYRSGDSEYLLNRAPVRLRDIRELFRDTGLGRDGYSVIGQGMITEIIKAKPADRRFLFEEAAGIAGLKFKKEESARKLNQAQENLVRVGDIITELAERLPSLEDKSRKARKFIEYSGEKKDLELFVWQKQAEKYTEELGKAAEVKKTFDDQLAESAEYFARAAEVEEQQNQRIRDLTVTMDETHTQKSETEAKAAAADAEIMVLNNDLEHLAEEEARLRKEDEQRDALLTVLSDELKQTEKRIAEGNERVAALEQSVAETVARRDSTRQKEEEAGSQASQTARETEELIGQLTALRIRKASEEQSLTDVKGKGHDLTLDGNDADEKLASLKKAQKESKNEADKHASIIQDNANKTEGYRMRYENRKGQADKKDAALQERRIALSKNQSRLQLLSDMEKHFEGFNFAVRTVMQESQRGILRGEMATVASVIDVDPKYAAAIEIALGSGIQNVITEDEACAKNAMLLLKNKNAGRATFLPRTTIKGTRLTVKGLDTEDGYVGLGCDLISYDHKYDAVMAFLLGRTVIAETIDAALEISRRHDRSFRIVTLDGQVVNAGGSMTGGSLSKNTGILTRRNEIESLTEIIGKEEESLKEAEEALRALRREVTAAEQAIAEINAQTEAAKQHLAKAKAEYDSYANYIADLTKENEERELQIRALTLREEQLIGQISETEREIAALTEQIAARETSAKETEELLETLKREQEAISEEMHKINLEVLSEQKTIEQNRTTAESLRLRMEDCGKSEEELLARREENRRKADEARAAILTAEEEKTRLRAEADGLADKIRALSEQRSSVEAEQNRMHAEQKELYEARERLSRESERAQARIEQLTEANESLLAKFWDEYELTLSEVVAMNLSFDLPTARRRAAELKEKIRALGHVDVTSIEEYATVKERHDTLSAQFEDINKAKGELESMIASLEEEMAKIFEEQLHTINEAFAETFREMFNGGEAKLRLDAPDNILESGVEIYAAPPGKIIKNLVSLSGGEQALTAIALYFAILKIKPSPFCLLDEIEAALDDVNVARYAAYLHRLSGKTQFVTITHRRGTMEEADKLYGVTMVNKGISRVIAIDVDEVSRMNLEKQ